MTVVAYIVVLIITGCTTSVLTILAWRQRQASGNIYFRYLLLAMTEWTFAALFEAATPHVDLKIFWSVVEYVGLVACGPLFLAFVMSFSRLERWLTRRSLLLLSILPMITLVVAATNNLHHWLWSSFTLDPSLNIVTYGHGPWFWVNAGYIYLLTLAAVCLLGWDAIRFRLVYRRQAILLLLAVLIPWAANAIYIFKIAEAPNLDWTSFSFSVTGIIFFMIIFRYQFMNLVPAARDRIIDSLQDGVIILDEKGQIADLNPSAARLLEISNKMITGQPAGTALAAWPSLLAEIDLTTDKKTVLETQHSPGLFLDLRISPLFDRRHRVTGKIILFRDITEQKQAETHLMEALDLNQKAFSSSLVGILVYKTSGPCVLANEAAARITRATVEALLKQDFRQIASWKKSGLLQMAEKALSTGKSQQGEVHLLTTFGRDIWANFALTPFLSNREPHLLLEFEDITERKQIERGEHEQRILAEALRDTAEALNSSLDLNVILDQVLVNLGRVMAYDSGELYLFDKQGNVQVVKLRYSLSLLPEGVNQNIQREASGFKTLKTVRETSKALIIPDVHQDPDWVVVPGLEWLASHVSAPITVKGKVIGVIGLSSREAGFFNEANCRPLFAFANEAAIAIENARLYTEVQRLAITDELTGLYNFRALMELGPREFERARRFNRSLVALFIDIDHFGDFNNRYTHAVGNQVLQAVAQTLLRGVRAMDIVARYGGEEFMILLPETDALIAVVVAERLRLAVTKALVPTRWGDLAVTVSIGLAELSAGMPNLEALIEAANQAEHEAKDKGRNRVVTQAVAPAAAPPENS